MEPAIYTIATVPTTVELGPATEPDDSEPCPVCGLPPDRDYKSVELVFDIWEGEDLVTAIDVYAVSERLRDALEQAGTTGARFEDIKVSKGDYFELTPEAYADELPRFYRLYFDGTATGPETWWTGELCEACGRRSWRRTDEGMDAEMAIALGQPAPPREVYRGSWSRDDLFRVEDPGPPLVTERAKEVFERLPVREVSFQPAEWIDE